MKTQITLKMFEIKSLLNILKKFETVKNKKIAYFALRNSHLLVDELAPLNELEKQFFSDEYKEFEQKRIELVNKYQLKDEANNPLVKDDGTHDFGENVEVLENEWKKLRAKYKSSIDERDEINKQYEEILKEDVELKVIKISFNDLPDDIIEATEFNIMKLLIKETDDELDELLFGEAEEE